MRGAQTATETIEGRGSREGARGFPVAAREQCSPNFPIRACSAIRANEAPLPPSSPLATGHKNLAQVIASPLVSSHRTR